MWDLNGTMLGSRKSPLLVASTRIYAPAPALVADPIACALPADTLVPAVVADPIACTFPVEAPTIVADPAAADLGLVAQPHGGVAEDEHAAMPPTVLAAVVLVLQANE